jgi:hypothetical protein
LATEAEAALEPFRPVAGETDAASVSAHICANSPAAPNVTVRDVAELLGDTEDMVRRHYAAWVTERQERLTNVLKEAFSEKPTPKFVEAPLDGRYIH